jgi:hypothetical protein
MDLEADDSHVVAHHPEALRHLQSRHGHRAVAEIDHQGISGGQQRGANPP